MQVPEEVLSTLIAAVAAVLGGVVAVLVDYWSRVRVKGRLVQLKRSIEPAPAERIRDLFASLANAAEQFEAAINGTILPAKPAAKPAAKNAAAKKPAATVTKKPSAAPAKAAGSAVPPKEVFDVEKPASKPVAAPAKPVAPKPAATTANTGARGAAPSGSR